MRRIERRPAGRSDDPISSRTDRGDVPSREQTTATTQLEPSPSDEPIRRGNSPSQRDKPGPAKSARPSDPAACGPISSDKLTRDQHSRCDNPARRPSRLAQPVLLAPGPRDEPFHHRLRTGRGDVPSRADLSTSHGDYPFRPKRSRSDYPRLSPSQSLPGATSQARPRQVGPCIIMLMT